MSGLGRCSGRARRSWWWWRYRHSRSRPAAYTGLGTGWEGQEDHGYRDMTCRPVSGSTGRCPTISIRPRFRPNPYSTTGGPNWRIVGTAAWLLSGSGPALFGFFSDQAEASEALAVVPAEARAAFARSGARSRGPHHRPLTRGHRPPTVYPLIRVTSGLADKRTIGHHDRPPATDH